MKKTIITRRLALLSESIVASGFGLIDSKSSTTVILSGSGSENYTCGKCGSILMKNINKSQIIGNSALKCNNCNNLNDANRYIDYIGTPVLLRDIPNQVENSVSFSYSPLSIDMSIPYATDRNALSDELYNNWISEHINMLGVLYQYTSFFGITGMLSNHSMWITDVAYMNDTSEMQYGIALINEYIAEKRKYVSDSCKSLLSRISIPASVFDSGSGYLISCFCANDDLLSQWRAYGGGGSGYNIGFSSAELCQAKDIQIRKVVYDPDKQQLYIKKTVDSICDLFESLTGKMTEKQLVDSNTYPAFAAMLSTHLNEFLFTFKHNSFAEEDEWRIIRPYQGTNDINKLKFRQYNSIPVPYMELNCKEINSKVPLLPIVQITHGPALHPQLTKKSLALIMRQNGYPHAEIKGSSTPLRL